MMQPISVQEERAASERRIKERLRRLTEMSAILARLYTTLAGRKVTVKVESNVGLQTPGWTIGNSISLNLPYMPTMTTNADVIVTYGLGYHELAHVLFTPTTQQISGDMTDGSLYSVLFGGAGLGGIEQRAFNILEDQRIETMLVAMYLSTRNYLKATVFRYNVSDATAAQSALIYTYGRKYLPAEIRKAVWDLSPMPVRTRREFASIIDAYRVLDLFKDRDMRTAARLVKRFAELMDENKMGSANGCGAPNDAHGTKQPPTGVKRIMQRVKEGAGNARGTGSAENAMSKGSDRPADGTDGGSGQSGKGSKIKKGSEDQTANEGGGNGEGEADEATDQTSNGSATGEEDSDATGAGGRSGDDGTGEGEERSGSVGNTAGTSGPAPTFTNREFNSLIEAAEFDIARSPEVRADVRKYNAAIGWDSIEGMGRDIIRVGVVTATDTEQGELNSLRRRIVKSLRRIEEDSDPYWQTHTNAGRPNIARIMQDPRAFDTNFDSWVESGDSGADMETVVLVDVSDSMRGLEEPLARAAWIMKSASDELRMPATIIAFSTSHKIVYSAKEHAEQKKIPGITCQGGTRPESALQTAVNVLARSRKRSRMLVIMTDGDWSRGTVKIGNAQLSEDDTIQLLGEAGIMTCLVNFGRAARGHHNAHIVENINDVSALPALYEQVLVRQLMQVNQRRR